MKKIPSVAEFSISPAAAQSRRESAETAAAIAPNSVVPVVIEVPKNSPNKYEFSKDLGLLELDRVLHSSVFYPGDYGYVPRTLCGDGDPIDVIVLSTYRLDPGIVADVRIVGKMDMEDEKGQDTKLIGVVAADPRHRRVRDLGDLPKHTKLEIQHFFETYKELENKGGKSKWAKIKGFAGRDDALKELEESRVAYQRAKEEESQRRLDSSVSTGAVVASSSQSARTTPPDYYHVPLGPNAPAIIPVYIEVPKGYNNKYEFDHSSGCLKLDRVLHSSVFYPGDYGFVPSTLCGDGDPLDVILVSSFPLVPGSLVDARVVGVMDMVDEKGPDAKVLAVVSADPRSLHIRDLTDVEEHVRAEIQHFFETYKNLEGGKWAKVQGWRDRQAAMQEVMDCHREYLKNPGTLGNVPKLYRLPIGSSAPRVVNAVVECTKGSTNKYKMSNELALLRLDRVLHSAIFYPHNYGFVPQTIAEDGKPVDIMILSFYPLNPYALVKSRVVGLLELEDEKGPDSKLIAVPLDEPRASEITDVDSIPRHMVDEVSNFFAHYKDLEDPSKWCRVIGWKSREEAVKVVAQSHERYYLFGLRMESIEERDAEMEKRQLQMEQRLADLERQNQELRQLVLAKEAQIKEHLKH